MYIIRPIKAKDLDTFEEFAKKSSLGVINLPKNRAVLNEKIKDSHRAFHALIKKPNFENYIFVLEDTATGELGGTSSIVSRMGITEPNYYFRIVTIANDYTKKTMQILTPVSYPIGPSEICALYVKAQFRSCGLGKLLSLSRFLFIANHPERFEDYTVAEMRGYLQDNHCLFWEAVCRKFLDISYERLCEMELESRAFIPSIMPKWPLYVCLLPKEAQETLAKTHDKTIPALTMLYKEGFTFTGEVDPFDGGPKLGCKTANIQTIKSSTTAIVDTIDSNLCDDRTYIIANTKIDFRACYGNIIIIKKSLVALSPEVAQALNVDLGDEIRFIKSPPREVT